MYRVQSHLRLHVITALLCVPGVAACGSSTSTATSPSSLTRCSVTLNGGGAVPAQGGSATIGVSAARECSWSARTDAAWLTIRSGASGQGDGSVELAASPNPDPAARRGAVVLNDTRFDVTQAAGECSFSLGQGSGTVPVQGGSGQVDLRASSALCSWSADSDVSWIVVRTPQGAGSAMVPFDVAPLGGAAPRTGVIRVAGLQFTVSQAQGCSYTITPATHAAGTGGGSGSISIATGAGCPWTVASPANWLTFSPASGSGPGAVSFSIAPSGGTSRSVTATVAGQGFTVTQSSTTEPGNCTYALDAASHAVGSAGGPVTVRVATVDTCTWSASSALPWAAVSGPSSFVGSDSVTFTVATTTGAARTGTVTVAGQPVAIAQAAACSYGLSTSAVNVPPGGGAASIGVTAGPGCDWTAASHVDWIAVTGGASGSGNGTVTIQVAPGSGSSRTGTMTIAGQTVTVTQSAPACTFAIDPQAQSLGAAGGTLQVAVSSSQGCAWTAASNVPWMSVTPPSGTGSGAVQVSVAANDGQARTGTATIAGRTFTLDQAAAAPACAYDVQPTSVERNWRPWQIELSVSTTAGCAWTAASSVDWLAVASGQSGLGSGTVVLLMSENAGAERRTIVVVAGQEVEVVQRSR